MKKYILLTLSLFFAAINFNLFLKPLNLVTGGTQGLVIIINKFLDIKPSILILIINIISLILSIILLKKETTTSLIYSSLIYPLFVNITSMIPKLSIIKIPILSAIIAGTICGTTGGIIYKLNFSQGGISILNNIFKHYFKTKISISNFIINSIIIIIGSFYFGFIKLLYSMIVISISSLIINLIMRKKLTKKLS